ncbi:Cytochrome b-c1 complex subunit 6 [Spatholobus suberectus]|nr:Cytochrome b-c1 complex subunit 6 [Spatholobus suberectus]
MKSLGYIGIWLVYVWYVNIIVVSLSSMVSVEFFCLCFFFLPIAFSSTYCISFIFGFYYEFRADEEPVDQKRYLEESCKPKCVKPLLEYQACIKRIHGDESGQKHCTGQYFDYWSCIDKCVSGGGYFNSLLGLAGVNTVLSYSAM